MSATVESPMPWRKAQRVASSQVTPGVLFRSSSSQSNLSASVSTSFSISSHQNPVSNSRQGVGDFGVISARDCVDGAAHRHIVSSDKTNAKSSMFCTTFRIGQNTAGDGVSKFDTLSFDAMSSNLMKPGVVQHRLLSKSSDQLTDLPFHDQPKVCPAEPGLLKNSCVSSLSWSPGSTQPQTCSKIPPAALSNSSAVEIKSDNVPSVRCELVAELLDIDGGSLLTSEDQLLILDCRPFVSYNANHIIDSLNVSCSDCITRKRLMTGRASLGDLVSGTEDAKERYRRAVLNARSAAGSVQFVVYDDDTEDFESLPVGHSLRLVVSCLRKAHVQVYYLYGAYVYIFSIF